jgi:hypothetical protein
MPAGGTVQTTPISLVKLRMAFLERRPLPQLAGYSGAWIGAGDAS